MFKPKTDREEKQTVFGFVTQVHWRLSWSISEVTDAAAQPHSSPVSHQPGRQTQEDPRYDELVCIQVTLTSSYTQHNMDKPVKTHQLDSKTVITN